MKVLSNKSLLSTIGGGMVVPVMGVGGLPPGWGSAEQVPLTGQLSAKPDHFSGITTPPSVPRSPISIGNLTK